MLRISRVESGRNVARKLDFRPGSIMAQRIMRPASGLVGLDCGGPDQSHRKHLDCRHASEPLPHSPRHGLAAQLYVSPPSGGPGRGPD